MASRPHRLESMYAHVRMLMLVHMEVCVCACMFELQKEDSPGRVMWMVQRRQPVIPQAIFANFPILLAFLKRMFLF